MAKLDEVCTKLIEKTKWIAITTDGPHVVGTWGDYVRTLGIGDDTLIIPVGRMHKTETNLKHDNHVILLCGTRQVLGGRGTPGQGCDVGGTAEFQTSGAHFDAVKASSRGHAQPWSSE